MKLFGCLFTLLSTFAVMGAVRIAPSDYYDDTTCRTDFAYRTAHDWIPYANDTSSGTWKVLIDQYDYQSVLGFGGVWKAIDADTGTPDGRTFTQGSGGTCTYQMNIVNSFKNSNSNNWVFTQAIDYLDAVELIVNATVRFTSCIQRRNLNPGPPCRNYYVILHRYDTNTLSETERSKPDNYQPYNGTAESSRLEQDLDNTNVDTTIIGRFRRPASLSYTYLGLQDIGTYGIFSRIFMYYEVCPGRVEGLVTYPEVPHPGRLPGALTRITRLARCANHSHNTTSLETYAYQDGRCKQRVKCDCDAGYEENGNECVACAAGTYRANTQTSSCVNCPANSDSLLPASDSCSCNEGYYRVSGSEGVEMGCTAPPAPISSCGISRSFDTALAIQWSTPAHCGGRSDCYYRIKVNNGPPMVPADDRTLRNLQSDTTYAITISVHNGVSGQDAENAKLRECTIVATTIRGSEFIFGGTTYPNNTAVILEHIGEEARNSLVCTTAHNGCCEADQQGKFYYPNGETVLSLSQASSMGQSLYLIRNKSSISLKRQPGGVFPPLGRYRCEIPDSKGTLQNLFFTIGTIQELSCPSECPTLPDCPTQQPPPTCPTDITPESIPVRINIDHANVHFELNGVILTNNSAVKLTDIGEGEGALLCKTDLLNCCRTPPNRFGEFFYPSGRQVPIMSRGEGFYRNRGEQIVRLNRREGVTSPTGRFRCTIPDTSGEMKSVYITINN